MNPTQAQYDLSKAEGIEFSSKSEPWVKYRLEDKTVLFARLVITKVYRTEQYDVNGQPVYAWSSQNLFTTVAPKENKGTPSDPPPTSLNPADYNVTPVDFERVGSEQWNIYELKDKTVLRIKLEVTGVVKTDKFSVDGDPFYIVSSGALTRMKVPIELLKKQTPKASPQRDVYK